MVWGWGSRRDRTRSQGSCLPHLTHSAPYLDQGARAGEQPERAVEAQRAHLKAFLAIAQLLPLGHRGGLQEPWGGPPSVPHLTLSLSTTAGSAFLFKK